jgi:hypothetical protein
LLVTVQRPASGRSGRATGFRPPIRRHLNPCRQLSRRPAAVLTSLRCGGFPGASPEAVGREVTFTGTLRTAGGMLAEHWANADSLLFFRQLGVRAVPARG